MSGRGQFDEKCSFYSLKSSKKWSNIYQQVYLFQIYSCSVSLFSNLLTFMVFCRKKIFTTFVFLSRDDFLSSVVTRLLYLQKILWEPKTFPRQGKKTFVHSDWFYKNSEADRVKFIHEKVAGKKNQFQTAGVYLLPKPHRVNFCGKSKRKEKSQ